MNFAIWLDGTVLKVDLTDQLYAIYKGREAELPVVKEAFEDSLEFLSKVSGRHEVVILSPYNEEVTGGIMRSVGLSFKYIAHRGRTKPSKDPYEQLFSAYKWDPLETITIGSSPLDLLSARFYDSRIKVVCVERFRDCSRYSPFLLVRDMREALDRLIRLRKVQL